MSRVLSPPGGYPSVYDKFVIDKWIKKRNTQKIFIHKFPNFQIPYFLEEESLIKENQS